MFTVAKQKHPLLFDFSANSLLLYVSTRNVVLGLLKPHVQIALDRHWPNLCHFVWQQHLH